MSEMYNRKGEPIAIEVWSELIRDWDYKQVKRTETKGLRISTVWLGLNHNYSKDGSPLIFETMVFELDAKGEMGKDVFCERHSTAEEAEERHDEIVNQVIDGTFKGYENE